MVARKPGLRNRWLLIVDILAPTPLGRRPPGSAREDQQREVVIEVPPDVVWAIVTEPPEVARWFSDEAAIDLRPGGAMLLTWHRYRAYRAPVEAVERPHTFAFRRLRREHDEPGDGTSMLVPDSPRKRLPQGRTGVQRLTWPEVDKARYADENTQGWIHELNEPRDYAARLGRS